MIARIWHGVTPLTQADTYDKQFLLELEPKVSHYEAFTLP